MPYERTKMTLRVSTHANQGELLLDVCGGGCSSPADKSVKQSDFRTKMDAQGSDFGDNPLFWRLI